MNKDIRHLAHRGVLSGTCAAVVTALGLSASAHAYTVTDVLVADDQYQGEAGVTPAPVYKPHETDASATPSYWISSNERGDESIPPGQSKINPANRAGITIFESGTNKVLSTLNIENACIPVIARDGSVFKKFGKCAPPGAEGHPRHPHGIDIDDANKLAYQVIEHSGLKWNSARTTFVKASKTDDESGLLVVYDISNLASPKLLAGYVLGHAAEEAAVNDTNGKVYVGNHEPSPTAVACFVSVVDRSKHNAPYKFIDLATNQDCVQGIEVDEGLNTVNGTTHIGEKMYTFNSSNDTIAYSVNVRGPFESFVNGLPPNEQFQIPDGWVLHMHDLTTDRVNHRAYQTIHTIADAATVEPEEGTEVVPEPDEITGRWVAEVNTDPGSSDFKKVRIIDLSNGQLVSEVRTHHDAIDTGLPFNQLFVHAHFLAVDPSRNSLIVSGEHTGNLGTVDTSTNTLAQVLPISLPIPGCVLTPDPETGEIADVEPHVHGTNIQAGNGTAYVSDEGEDCLYESVTILSP